MKLLLTFDATVRKVPDLDGAYVDSRANIQKQPGDTVRVTLRPRDGGAHAI